MKRDQYRRVQKAVGFAFHPANLAVAVESKINELNGHIAELERELSDARVTLEAVRYSVDAAITVVSRRQ